MDSMDKEILDHVQRNGRIHLSKLAEALGRPRTSVALRMEKLEREGVIMGYRALLDPVKLGFNVLALVLISVKRTAPSGGKSAQVLLAEKIIRDCDEESNLPWIEEAYIVTGHYDILLKVWAKDLKQLSHFLINYLPTHQDISQTETMLVLEAVADNRSRIIPVKKIE